MNLNHFMSDKAQALKEPQVDPAASMKRGAVLLPVPLRREHAYSPTDTSPKGDETPSCPTLPGGWSSGTAIPMRQGEYFLKRRNAASRL